MVNLTSITGRIWQDSTKIDDLTLKELVKESSLPKPIAKILVDRGISAKEVKGFLEPKLKNVLVNPNTLKDIEKAAKEVFDVLVNNQKILILGDYDVDGLTSSAIMYRYLKELGIEVFYRIPSRYNEGYGGAKDSIDYIKAKEDVSLVIMLDNGSNAHDFVKDIALAGKKVIIIDHHIVDDSPPKEVSALINPKQNGDTSNLDYLCTAGILFLFLVYMNSFLSKKEEFKAKKLPDILKYLDLVALATVCDVMPHSNLNKAYIVQGLRVLKVLPNSGLKHLISLLGISKLEYDCLGYSIGPCINAASRMGSENIAMEFLIEDKEEESKLLAFKLKGLNEQRQNYESLISQKVILEVEQNMLANDFIFTGSKDYMQGIIGIIAGRVKDSYNKPACIFSVNEKTQIATASGRSTNGVNLGEIVLKAKNKGLLIKGGGHSKAVGFSFDMGKKEEISKFFSEEIKNGNNKENPDIYAKIDCSLSLNAVNKDFYEDLEKIMPFVNDFSEPIFKFENMLVENVRVVGKNKNHLSFMLNDGVKKIKAMSFKSFPGVIGNYLLNLKTKPVSILGLVKANDFQGEKNIYILVLDIIE